jgi:hypothetical protein
MQIEPIQYNEVKVKNIKKEIINNKPFGDKSPLIGFNLDNSRIYKITDEKDNILTKEGEDNT